MVANLPSTHSIYLTVTDFCIVYHYATITVQHLAQYNMNIRHAFGADSGLPLASYWGLARYLLETNPSPIKVVIFSLTSAQWRLLEDWR